MFHLNNKHPKHNCMHLLMELLMNFDYSADNIIIDLHDNFSYTLAHLDRPKLLLSLEKVNKYAFKSNYHLACFEEFIGRKLNGEEYFIALNGVRVEQFKNNKNHTIVFSS